MPRSRLPWSLVLPWTFSLAILIGTAVLAFWPHEVKSVPVAPGTSGALVWGDGVFANGLQLQAWLRLHGGVSYRKWAIRHPAGVRLVAPKPTTLRPRTTVKKAHIPAAKPRLHPAAKSQARPKASPVAATKLPTADLPALPLSEQRPRWLYVVAFLLVSLPLLLMVRLTVRFLRGSWNP